MTRGARTSDALGAYGRLTEGLHIAGYTFERARSNLETLLEGDRWKLDGRFTHVNAFMDSIRLDKFRAVAEAAASASRCASRSFNPPPPTDRSPARWA